MRKDSRTDAQKKYEDFRRMWARENAELFLDTLKKVGEELGTELKPIQFVKAWKICVDDLRFAYPAEFKIAELISTEETYEQALNIMTALMKRFRLAFWKEWKKRDNRKKAQKKRRAA